MTEMLKLVSAVISTGDGVGWTILGLVSRELVGLKLQNRISSSAVVG